MRNTENSLACNYYPGNQLECLGFVKDARHISKVK
jgi:hypothetical protein